MVALRRRHWSARTVVAGRYEVTVQLTGANEREVEDRMPSMHVVVAAKRKNAKNHLEPY